MHYPFQMQQTLEKEIEMLKVERRELEQYVERTDMWCEFAGKWRTDICSSKVRRIIDKGRISGTLCDVANVAYCAEFAN